MTAITAKTIRRMLLTRLALAAVVGLGDPHGAQTGVDVWTNTGPEGGTIQALAIDPQKPATLYAAVSHEGSWGSTDVYQSTGSWRAVAVSLPGALALAIDPQTPTTLYAGTSAGVFALQRTTARVATTVSFDAATPTGGPGPLDGVFEGIDFGTGEWAWEGPYGAGPTNHIYFADSTGTSRTLAFSPAPRVLESVSVFSPTPGTLTLSDDTGQMLTREVRTGSMQFVTTGWTRAATTVTVSFTDGWALGVDDITSSTAP